MQRCRCVLRRRTIVSCEGRGLTGSDDHLVPPIPVDQVWLSGVPLGNLRARDSDLVRFTTVGRGAIHCSRSSKRPRTPRRLSALLLESLERGTHN
ncbi:uncharacterized protein LACBIDRAFT_318249 [Laccaria bicolor S238N-H82]|uniref:Predicted protein n=1 Tax=Laccaria bicolor (strain S238N-H82 / ATCC MYA-4686) TaxID=486041 RepID=B0D6A6_LACBS|nr:uncharacterized protein LACBIDRAFT_318249 [Laccaria bicolor S238N-H82]EDR10161.1 predicted protein [Laccaria bicolor S238N-H82]|eukprot:XP_001879546.1 predicted protein [Laccaria bicolor S238N-H82]